MLKIYKLGIKNFVGLEDATLEFSKLVSLIAGLNNAGKSSIKDALLFAFTGKCRSVTKYKDVTSLAYQSSEDMEVWVGYTRDDEPCTITRGIKDASKGVDLFNPLIRFCIQPAEFLSLSSGERGGLISEVLGAGMTDLAKKAMATYVGNIPNEMLIELKGTGVDFANVDALREEIILLRRTYKKQQSALSLKTPTLGSYGLTDSFKITPTEKKIKALMTKMDEIHTLLGHISSKTEIQNQIATHQKLVKQLKSELKPLTNAEQQLLDEFTRSKVAMEVLRAAFPAQPDLEAEITCPVCGETTTQNKLLEYADVLDKTVSKSEEAAGELEVRFKSYTTTLAKVESYEASILKLKESLKAIAGGLKEDDLRKELKTVQRQKETLWNLVLAYRNYKRDLEVRKDAGEEDGRLNKLITESNRIVDLLKDGGKVKSYIAKQGKQLPINSTLLEVWGMPSLKWYDNGVITLEDRPIELASESEKYRAACVMGLAIAEVGKVGFACLDGYEILVGENAGKFFEAIDESNIEQVFLFVSTAKKYTSKNTDEDLDIFMVREGKVKKL